MTGIGELVPKARTVLAGWQAEGASAMAKNAWKNRFNPQANAHLFAPAFLLARSVFNAKYKIMAAIKVVGMSLANGVGAYALKKYNFTVSAKVAFATMAIVNTGLSGDTKADKLTNQRYALFATVVMAGMHYMNPPGYAMSKYAVSVILGVVTGGILNGLNPS